jgi:deazaflavin-dependent oxidoreductase (nitroreductase family)
MKPAAHAPSLAWRIMRRLNHRVARNYRHGIGPARVVLLLTTTGRKTGQPRQTPLQYELVDGKYYLGSARGSQADWFRNLEADPYVQVQIRQQKFSARAEAITDPAQIADFLAERMHRHPIFIGLLLRLEGLPLRYSRADLERVAAGKALAILHPDKNLILTE